MPGKWANLPNLPGRGWNMIALPFAAGPGVAPFRLLLNQFNEELEFFLVDKGVPNRGIGRSHGAVVESDQLLSAIDYEQDIRQIVAEDQPVSHLAGAADLPIHHEPGLWLHFRNETADGIDVARIASIPHGDSVLALGTSKVSSGPPAIPAVNGLPVGVTQDLNNPYLAPYKHFHDSLFRGLFDPTLPHLLLAQANVGVNILRTTELKVDTAIESGGIRNVPFVVRQANAGSMKSTFWVQELAELDAHGRHKLRLQYLQVVILEFFPRTDGLPGLIQWPHVSINTMEWVGDSPG